MKFSLQVGHSTNSNIRTPLQFSKTPNGRVKDVQNRHFGLQIKRSLHGYFQHGFGLGYYSNMASGWPTSDSGALVWTD